MPAPARRRSPKVLFAAYTGKAAHVMRTKGCKDASTLHSLIYKCLETEDGPQFELTSTSPLAEAKLLIIDECSMVDATLGNDILSFGVPVLVLGDPAQLPPVFGDEGFFTEALPDVLLTDIQRQARESPIIDMATTVREGGRLVVGDYDRSRVVRRDAITLAELASADQVLVGRNRTRHRVNERLRDHLGLYGAVPQPADRLVCLRNNHRRGLLNGSTWRARTALANGDSAVMLGIVPDDDDKAAVINTTTHLAFFRGTAEQELSYFERRQFDPFDFAYGLTVHKAQGSQWPDVTIFDEAGVFGAHGRRWLYTAITRAADRLTLVLSDRAQ